MSKKMSKKPKAKKAKAKPVKAPVSLHQAVHGSPPTFTTTSGSNYFPPITQTRTDTTEAERVRKQFEAERLRVAAEVAALLHAKQPESAWVRVWRFIAGPA